MKVILTLNNFFCCNLKVVYSRSGLVDKMIQNEILGLTAKHILQEISLNIQQ